MLEKAIFVQSRRYWLWVLALLVVIGAAFATWYWQFKVGLTITGMSRDVSWGFYIAQFTFLVGVAASAVMLVLPYYLHNYKVFGRITILGEFLAVAAVTMCVLFIVTDLGRPDRGLNVMLHPTPNSVLFWDFVVLSGYLILNILVGWVVLTAERKEVGPPKWIKPFIYLSIPWAVSIHTVTAFLYAGLPGRGYWLTAIMAARFLSSAFAAGPAFLVILCLVLRKLTRFEPGKEAIQTLGTIVTYAIILNVFFFFLEVFTVGYSQIPDHLDHFRYLFFGLHGHSTYVPWMWASFIIAFTAIGVLLRRKARSREGVLALGCALVFIATWIDKGLGMIAGGFTPNPLHEVYEYVPTPPELLISLGVWAMGLLILTVLYRIAVSVKKEVEA